MVNFERIEPLPHIVIERAPRQELIRPHRRGPSRIQPRSDRREHAERMKDQTAASAAELARLRASFGVAPDRFLVLRLETLDVDQRDTLERLNVAVVEEVEEVRDGTTVHRLLVQFPDSESLTTFTTEYDRYADETTETTALPHAMRRNLFDALESVSTVTAEERTGRRLQREGPPTDALFYLDVDLWNTGTDNGQRDLSNFFRAFVQSRGARIARNPLITPSLFLIKFDPASADAAFPAEERVENQLKRAIEYFHGEYGCRVFNLSIGHVDRLYEGGRQLPWAELLDDLARTLDIVIVISAGNVGDPDIPAAFNSAQFKEHVAGSLKQPQHRLIDPATSALSLKVGAVARRDDPSMLSLSQDTPLAASSVGCPSPFTRCGPGVVGAVKPEVVAPGGNYGLDSIAGRHHWRRNDPNLGEPTLNRDFASRLLRGVCGTSLAAGQVTHIAARIEAALRNDFQTPPTQNLVRALLVSSARPNDNVSDYVDKGDLLNTVGYGQPNVEYCWSTPNRVSLIAEDIVGYRTFHLYSLVVPEDFLQEPGRRSISVALAYDPPTRLSRREYIATAMWLEVFGGLTTEQVVEYRSRYEGDGEPPRAPDKNKLNFSPAGQTIRMSPVQKRSWSSNQGTVFLNRPVPNGDASLHIFVGCQPRFPNPLGEDSQRYALVVTLEHDSQNIDVYQQVRTRARTRARIGLAG